MSAETETSGTLNLTHHFLIAMPGMQDEMFSRSVVYVCEHSDKGALGIIINKPVVEMTLDEWPRTKPATSSGLLSWPTAA